MNVTLGHLEYIVLLVVMRLGEDAYGVPIARAVEEAVDRNLALASVYAALDRLETKGLVSSKLASPTPERGGRAKTYYRPTAKGLNAARETRRTLSLLWNRLPQTI